MFEDRIEVLRGPQGTLYGRNAIAGTINSISKRPTQDWTAEVRVKVGNYDTRDFEGMVSGPINDTMRFKFGGYRNYQGDGYYRNVFNGKSESSNLSNGNFFYWEGQFEWDITPDVRILDEDSTNWATPTPIACRPISPARTIMRPIRILHRFPRAPHSAPPASVECSHGHDSVLPTGFLPNAPQCATNPANNNINTYCNDTATPPS